MQLPLSINYTHISYMQNEIYLMPPVMQMAVFLIIFDMYF